MSPANGQQVKAGTQAGRKESREAAEVAQEKGRGRVSEGSGRRSLGAAGGLWHFMCMVRSHGRVLSRGLTWSRCFQSPAHFVQR